MQVFLGKSRDKRTCQAMDNTRPKLRQFREKHVGHKPPVARHTSVSSQTNTPNFQTKEVKVQEKVEFNPILNCRKKPREREKKKTLNKKPQKQNKKKETRK